MIWKSTTVLLLLTFMSFYTLVGQELLPVKKAEFVDGMPERKTAFSKIKEAQNFYEKGIGYVANSLSLFLEAYELNKKNPELNFNIGICYLITGPRNKALPYLLSAELLDTDISEDIHFFIGLAYQYQNNFSKAIVHFKMNIELIRQNKYDNKMELIPLSEKHIAECNHGKQFFENVSDVEIELLPKVVNSEFDEFNPLLVDKNLFFSSRRGVDGTDHRSAEDQKFFEKVYKVQLKDNTWGSPAKESDNVGTKSNVALLSKYQENQFALYASNSGAGDIYFTEKQKNKWKIGKELNFMNEKKFRESSASFTRDGNEVYFVSNRKGGFGECDIYYSTKNDKGKWSKPVNIGGNINTTYDEGDVFVTQDGTELYFSSKGHNSMGGYDIFRCEKMSAGGWSKPENLGVPINSADNDINFFKDENGRFYFASERSEGFGGFDLYSEKIPEPEIVEEVSQKEVETPIVLPNVPVKTETIGLTEIPVKQELVKEDFIYRVQIAACRKEMNPTDLFRRYKGGDVIEHLFVEGWHRYTIGGFSTYEEAAKHRDACGVSDAFVVLFKGGYRLGIAKKPISAK